MGLSHPLTGSIWWETAIQNMAPATWRPFLVLMLDQCDEGHRTLLEAPALTLGALGRGSDLGPSLGSSHFLPEMVILVRGNQENASMRFWNALVFALLDQPGIL